MRKRVLPCRSLSRVLTTGTSFWPHAGASPLRRRRRRNLRIPLHRVRQTRFMQINRLLPGNAVATREYRVNGIRRQTTGSSRGSCLLHPIHSRSSGAVHPALSSGSIRSPEECPSESSALRSMSAAARPRHTHKGLPRNHTDRTTRNDRSSAKGHRAYG